MKKQNDKFTHVNRFQILFDDKNPLFIDLVASLWSNIGTLNKKMPVTFKIKEGNKTQHRKFFVLVIGYENDHGHIKLKLKTYDRQTQEFCGAEFIEEVTYDIRKRTGFWEIFKSDEE